MLDLSTVLHNFDGAPLMVKDGDDVTPMTLQKLCLVLLTSNYRDEPLSTSDSIKRFLLAQRVHGGGEIAFTSDEVSLLIELCTRSFAPIVLGRLIELIDPARLK